MHRTLNMVGKFGDKKVYLPKITRDVDAALTEEAKATVEFYKNAMENMEISEAVKKVWGFVSRANKYIDETAPWALAKDETKKEELSATLYNLAASLRIIAILIEPYMPQTAENIWSQLALKENFKDVRLTGAQNFQGIEDAHEVGKAKQLFPRIEVK